MKKTDLRKMIKEELKKVLKEGGGYIEIMEMDPNYEKGLKLLKQVWYDWVKGPATERNMIKDGKKEFVADILNTITKW